MQQSCKFILCMILVICKTKGENSDCLNDAEERHQLNNGLLLALSHDNQLGIDWHALAAMDTLTSRNITVRWTDVLTGDIQSRNFSRTQHRGAILPAADRYLSSGTAYIAKVSVGECQFYPKYVVTADDFLKASSESSAESCGRGVYTLLLQAMPTKDWSYSASENSLFVNTQYMNYNQPIDTTVEGYKNTHFTHTIHPRVCVGAVPPSQTFADAVWLPVDGLGAPLAEYFLHRYPVNLNAESLLKMFDPEIVVKSQDDPQAGFRISPANTAQRVMFGAISKRDLQHYHYFGVGIEQYGATSRLPPFVGYSLISSTDEVISRVPLKMYFLGLNVPESHTNSTFDAGSSNCKYLEDCGQSTYVDYCSIKGEHERIFCPHQPVCMLECALKFPVLWLHQRTKTSLEICWSPFDTSSMQYSSNFQGYMCEHKLAWNAPPPPQWVSGMTTDTCFTMEGLTSYTRYIIRCWVLANKMSVVTKDTVYYTTSMDVPSEAPGNFTGKAASFTSACFYWLPPSNESRHGILDRYRIQCINAYDGRVKVVFASSENDTAIMSGLQAWTVYRCNIAACTQVGCGALSEYVLFETWPMLPIGIPELLSAVYINSTAIRVKWLDIGTRLWGKTDGRYFCLIVEREDLLVLRKCFLYPQMEYDVIELEPYTRYSFVLFARNAMGDGPKSHNKYFAYTDQLPPDSSPKNPRVESVETNEIFFSWQPLQESEVRGVLESYTVHVKAVNLTQADYLFFHTNHTNDSNAQQSLVITRRKRRSLVTPYYAGPLCIEKTMEVKDNNVIIDGLFGRTTYAISVRANTRYNGTFSQEKLTTTAEGTPVVSAVGVRCCSSTHSSVGVCWHDAPSLYLQGERTNYTLLFKEDKQVSYESLPPTTRRYEQQMLKPVLKYMFSVVASTNQGKGVSTQPITCLTKELYPNHSPENITASSLQYVHATTIKWSAIPFNLWQAIPRGYMLKYRRVANGEEIISPGESWTRINTSSLNTTYLLTGLKVFSRYQVKLAGYTKAGVGKYSLPVEFSTCRVTDHVIRVHYMIFEPYVSLPTKGSNRPQGIIVNAVDQALLKCAIRCESFTDEIEIVYEALQHTNTSLMLDMAKQTSHVYLPVEDPLKFIMGAQYANVATSSGFLLLKVPPKMEQALFDNEQKFLTNIFDSLSVFILYFSINMVFGGLFFCCEPLNVRRKKKCYALYSIFEGFYYVLMTSTTVGYGDKMIRTKRGRIFMVFWTMLGLLLTGICIGNVSSAISASTLGELLAVFPNDVAIGREGSTEYAWAVKKMKTGNDTFFTYKEVVDGLIASRAQYGIIDQFSVLPYNLPLQKAGIEVNKIYQSQLGRVGMILGGKMALMAPCVKTFLEDNKDLVDNAFSLYKKRIDELVKNATANSTKKSSSNEPTSARLVSWEAPLFRRVLVYLCCALIIMWLVGIAYEVVKWAHVKRKAQHTPTTLERQLMFQKEVKAFLVEYRRAYVELCERVSRKTDKLLRKHKDNILELAISFSELQGVHYKFARVEDLDATSS